MEKTPDYFVCTSYLFALLSVMVHTSWPSNPYSLTMWLLKSYKLRLIVARAIPHVLYNNHTSNRYGAREGSHHLPHFRMVQQFSPTKPCDMSSSSSSPHVEPSQAQQTPQACPLLVSAKHFPLRDPLGVGFGTIYIYRSPSWPANPYPNRLAQSYN